MTALEQNPRFNACAASERTVPATPQTSQPDQHEGQGSLGVNGDTGSPDARASEPSSSLLLTIQEVEALKAKVKCKKVLHEKARAFLNTKIAVFANNKGGPVQPAHGLR